MRALRVTALRTWDAAVRDDPPLPAAASGLWDGIIAGTARPGRPPKSDHELALVAQLYVRSLHDGPRDVWSRFDDLRKDPSLPDWLQRAKMPRLKAWVAESRRRDILSPTVARRASGRLTAYGESLR
jgi:hypothetical protein